MQRGITATTNHLVGPSPSPPVRPIQIWHQSKTVTKFSTLFPNCRHLPAPQFSPDGPQVLNSPPSRSIHFESCLTTRFASHASCGTTMTTRQTDRGPLGTPQRVQSPPKELLNGSEEGQLGRFTTATACFRCTTYLGHLLSLYMCRVCLESSVSK